MAKLIGDKQKAEVVLSDKDKAFLSALLEPTGKLGNFWLDVVVARPELLMMNVQTLLK